MRVELILILIFPLSFSEGVRTLISEGEAPMIRRAALSFPQDSSTEVETPPSSIAPISPPCSLLYYTGRNAVKPTCLHMWTCKSTQYTQVPGLSIEPLNAAEILPNSSLQPGNWTADVSTSYHGIIWSSCMRINRGIVVSCPEQRQLRAKSAMKQA